MIGHTYRLDCGHAADVYGPHGPTTGRAWCTVCDESSRIEPQFEHKARKLWVLHETGACYVFPHEGDARRAVTEELRRGLRVEHLISVSVPANDYESYSKAVREDQDSAHLHPAFEKAASGSYPTISIEEIRGAPEE